MIKSQLYREIAEKRNILRATYGGMMTLENLRKELGYNDPKAARRFAQESGIPLTQIGKMKRYDTDCVAKVLVEGRGTC